MVDRGTINSNWGDMGSENKNPCSDKRYWGDIEFKNLTQFTLDSWDRGAREGNKARAVPSYTPTPMPVLGLAKGDWSDSALKVLKERYLKRMADGEQETPEHMAWRVADFIAHAELKWGTEEDKAYWRKNFYNLMVSRDFFPNTPCLVNGGRNNGMGLFACFVAPIEDSIPGIYETLKNTAMIFAAGGGLGYEFSSLRPKNTMVHSTQGVTSGPISFMKVYDASSQQISQGGVRRGASMSTFKVDHPDILDFVHCKLFKEDGTRDITNFNISVLVTDAFMTAVENNETYPLQFNGTHYGEVHAREIFDEMCRCAYLTGDPGCIFIDRINNSTSNPIPKLDTITAVNPCSEQALFHWDACNLGSINLKNFVEGGAFNFKRLEQVAEMCLRFLDNAIEINPYPLEKIKDKVMSLRRVGLGIMGLADALFLLKIPYDSEEGRLMAQNAMAHVNRAAVRASEDLATVRGAFTLFDQSVFSGGPLRRNCNVTTIAPTGSLSIFANCGSGVEPVFALAYQHTVKLPDGSTRVLNLVNPTFEEMARKEKFWSETLAAYVGQFGTTRGFTDYELPAWVRRVFVNAHEVSIGDHIRMQAAMQKHVESGISKTINAPNSATINDVKNAYLLAYRLGCKGVTVFRDGCLSTGQVLNVGVATPDTTYLAMSANGSEKPVNIDQYNNLLDGIDRAYAVAPVAQSVAFKEFNKFTKKGCPNCGEIEQYHSTARCSQCDNCGHSSCSL